MRVVKLRDILDVSTISQDKTWKELNNKIDSMISPDEEILLDLEGITIDTPWSYSNFSKFIEHDNIHLLVMNKPEFAKSLRMYCTLDGCPDDKVYSIVIPEPKAKTSSELKVEKEGNHLKSKFKIEGNHYTFDVVAESITQLFNASTVAYIKYAIDSLINESDIKEYYIKCGNVDILDDVVDAFSQLMLHYKNKGVQLLVDTDNLKAGSLFVLYNFKNTHSQLSDKDKKDLIENAMAINEPGILMKYRNSRATDAFGRYGDGEVVSSRIAIYKGLTTDKYGDICVMIDSFNNDTFYTKRHWAVDNDGEELENLTVDSHVIPLRDIGIKDLFLGSSYHFIKPIQRDIKESQVIVVASTDDDCNIKSTCTIPERMAFVFDDWDIEYNQELMHQYIKETRELLNIEDTEEGYKYDKA